ncbi:uncharacterized protein BX664DRAFT_188637 [Halteromyces radiatus]|uniref:uncharacterized protein n=1 Tax=Halteromyces radiatus TaxID=101107 RepID=UPI0022201F4A|nr:uncharacterized protein BX664DRAFT_188637 [Halteromyces radiatus]KAI8083065.1 hypothetical protein BX664DRAFT_188637 [Halteromyces radiatus]
MTSQEQEPLLAGERTSEDDNERHPSSESSQQFVRLENRLQSGRFTSLEKLLFIVSISLFIILTIFVGLYARRVYDDHPYPPTPNPPQDNNETTPLCMTPECVLTAAQVLQDIDLTVDPCEDFYAYSCELLSFGLSTFIFIFFF